jgi:hypothetical protein
VLGKRVLPNRYIFESLGQIARAYDETPAETDAKPGLLRRVVTGFLDGLTSRGRT